MLSFQRRQSNPLPGGCLEKYEKWSHSTDTFHFESISQSVSILRTAVFVGGSTHSSLLLSALQLISQIPLYLWLYLPLYIILVCISFLRVSDLSWKIGPNFDSFILLANQFRILLNLDLIFSSSTVNSTETYDPKGAYIYIYQLIKSLIDACLPSVTAIILAFPLPVEHVRGENSWSSIQIRTILVRTNICIVLIHNFYSCTVTKFSVYHVNYFLCVLFSFIYIPIFVI